MSEVNTKKRRQLGFIGNGGCGKSSLILRFIQGEYTEQFDPTISDSYYKSFMVDNIMEDLVIEDTSGQQEYWEHIQYPCIQESGAFMVVYDITREGALEDVKFFLKKIKESKNSGSNKIPVIIVGNKCDLESKTKVTFDECKELKRKSKDDDILYVKCIQTSAKEGTNVQELFEKMVKMMRICDTLPTGKQNSLEKKEDINDCDCKCSCNIRSIFCKKNTRRTYILGDLRLSNIKNNPKLRIIEPILSLKQFIIKSDFDCKTFMKAMGCSVGLPIVIIFQEIAFLAYTDKKEYIVCYYPKNADYSEAKYGMLYDFLGLIVGRKPGQDPEAPKDVKWFLRQTRKQKIKRVILMIIVIGGYVIMIHNALHITDYSIAIMEALGPLILYFTLWILFASYIAYQPKVEPSFGLVPRYRLRKLYLSFGEDYSKVVTVYTFLRLYYKCINDTSLALPSWKTGIIGFFSGVYAVVPIFIRGLTGNHEYTRIVIFNGIIANFILSFTFIYSIEAVYAKSFGNYQKWMKDFTLLLSKTANLSNNENLFLSLLMNCNVQSWLECRSYLAIEGKILFAKQQIPTLYIIIIVISLSIYLLYRVFFINTDPFVSITFNGAGIFNLVCIGLLIRIAITGYAFADIQAEQEELLTQQRYFVNCSKTIRGVFDDDDDKPNNTELKTSVTETKPKVIIPKVDNLEQAKDDNELEHTESKTNESGAKPQPNTTNANANRQERDNDDSKHTESNKSEAKPPHNTTNANTIRQTNNDDLKDTESKTNNSEIKPKVNTPNADTIRRTKDDNDSKDAKLKKRELQKRLRIMVMNDGTSLETKISILSKVSFIEQTLDIVKKKDIYPRLFGIKLNNVLPKTLIGVTITLLAALIKVIF